MRKQKITSRLSAVLFALVVVLACSGSALAGANIIVINADGPNEGFNDPTPVAPVGGNPGTTLGAQRLFAFQFAANIWGATLDSNQNIYVFAAFNPLAANVLGAAGAWDVFSDFPGTGLHPGAEFPATWYGSALADKRAGVDQDSTAPDIIATFSSNFNFYLGVDNNHGPLNDLVAVLLHELGHGLGFQNFVNEGTGAELGNFTSGGRFYPVQPDVYERHTFDNTTGKFWHLMTQAERAASAVRYGRVVWDGTNVNNGVPSVLSFGSPETRILTPASIAGAYQFNTAAFGAPISSPGITAQVVDAQDAANVNGPTTTDACTALTNAAAVAGKIALVERGTCTFARKARTVEDAGAIGMIIYNNLANANSAPIGMAGDPMVNPQPTITSVSLTRADGLLVLAQIPSGTTARLSVDLSIRAGADETGKARLYMPFPVSSGSSGSHYDTVASRNLLMEPFINADLTHSVKAPEDLTLELLRDIGWFPDADTDGKEDGVDCEPNSNLDPTVAIGSCDSGVTNTLFNTGCTINDLIAHIAANSNNHGQFVAGVARLTAGLVNQGLITAAQKDAIVACAGSSNLP